LLAAPLFFLLSQLSCVFFSRTHTHKRTMVELRNTHTHVPRKNTNRLCHRLSSLAITMATFL
uniref:Uncharacterized protein n=1 Tax=Aegilops tauschii subsp. strangulata TaxID=200361 RepID=A0A452YBN0_AEGTS